MEIHVQSLTEATEEVGYRFGSVVRRDMGWSTMLGEYVKDKEFG